MSVNTTYTSPDFLEAIEEFIQAGGGIDADDEVRLHYQLIPQYQPGHEELFVVFAFYWMEVFVTQEVKDYLQEFLVIETEVVNTLVITC